MAEISIRDLRVLKILAAYSRTVSLKEIYNPLNLTPAKAKRSLYKLASLNFVKKVMHGYYSLNSIVSNKIKEKGVDIFIPIPKVK